MQAVRQHPPERRRGPRLLLRGAGLLAVAIVSGLVWWLVRSDGGAPAADELTPPPDPLTSGEFTYTPVAGPERSTDCASNSYGDVSDWFGEHPCERVARALYSTEVGRARALVSVVVVTMPGQTEARQLKVITDTDGTGNVNDLVRDESANLPGAPNVAEGEYASRAQGRAVTIVEAAFFGDHSDDGLLRRISRDALRLSAATR